MIDFTSMGVPKPSFDFAFAWIMNKKSKTIHTGYFALSHWYSNNFTLRCYAKNENLKRPTVKPIIFGIREIAFEFNNPSVLTLDYTRVTLKDLAFVEWVIFFFPITSLFLFLYDAVLLQTKTNHVLYINLSQKAITLFVLVPVSFSFFHSQFFFSFIFFIFWFFYFDSTHTRSKLFVEMKLNFLIFSACFPIDVEN